MAKLILISIFVLFAGWVTSTEFKDIKTDDIVYSKSNNMYHDVSCKCGYCIEESAYYLEIAGNDTTLKLGQELTVMSIETLSNNGDTLTAVMLK